MNVWRAMVEGSRIVAPTVQDIPRRPVRNPLSAPIGYWWERALCSDVDPAVFFPSGRADRARNYCRACPVRLDCLEEELRIEAGSRTAGMRAGVRGGLSADQRLRRAERAS